MEGELAVIKQKVVFCYENGDSQPVTFSYNTRAELMTLVTEHLLPKINDVSSITFLEKEHPQITWEQVEKLADMVDDGKLSRKLAFTVFKIMKETGEDPVTIIKEQGLTQC
jgi:Asp-tRNA(Asn)/Glu-tRNA(Gln) amidotransferase B subunit